MLLVEVVFVSFGQNSSLLCLLFLSFVMDGRFDLVFKSTSLELLSLWIEFGKFNVVCLESIYK